MRVTRIGGLLRVLVASLVWVAGPGCSLERGPDAGRDTPNIPATRIVVKVVNQTDQPLDPQLYVGLADNGVGRLFIAANQRTDFGIGSIGILLPKNEDSLDVDCNEHVFVATRGGVFGEDLTDPRGRGEPIVLEEGLNVRCGDVVTFTFRDDGDGLLTSYAVQAQGS